jgi:hypothetical protein
MHCLPFPIGFNIVVSLMRVLVTAQLTFVLNLQRDRRLRYE